MTGSSDDEDARFHTVDFLKSQLDSVEHNLRSERNLQIKALEEIKSNLEVVENKLESRLEVVESKLGSKLGIINEEFNTLIKDKDSSDFEGNEELTETRYTEDAYMNMMMSTPFISLGWIFGFVIFLTQVVMVVLIFQELRLTSFGVHLRDIARLRAPSLEYTVAQFFAIIVSCLLQGDIFSSFHLTSELWLKLRENPTLFFELIGLSADSDQNQLYQKFFSHVMFPNIFKFLQASFVQIISFVLIVQSEDILELFKDFSAVQLISMLDEFAFELSSTGVFGVILFNKSEEVKKVVFRSKSNERNSRRCCIPIQSIGGLMVALAMFSGWIYVVYGQESLLFPKLKWNKCNNVDLGFFLINVTGSSTVRFVGMIMETVLISTLNILGAQYLIQML